MSAPDRSASTPSATRVVFVTGPSGAGRTTVINTLEDLGFEAIDNMPLSLATRLLEGPPPERPMALGVDPRTRDFNADKLAEVVAHLAQEPQFEPELLYVDCDVVTLRRRYSETRRRHPLAPDSDPSIGIARERDLLAPLRSTASILIDTSNMTPHELRDEVARQFSSEGTPGLSLTVTSFSYRRGLPNGADLVFDCRFLRNPHWDADLRAKDGRDADVHAYIAQDARFECFVSQIKDMINLLLPAFRDEGKTHLTVAFGCTGGKHRSVAMAEILAAHLAEGGWRVSKRHREVERRRSAAPSGDVSEA